MKHIPKTQFRRTSIKNTKHTHHNVFLKITISFKIKQLPEYKTYSTHETETPNKPESELPAKPHFRFKIIYELEITGIHDESELPAISESKTAAVVRK